MLAASYLPVSLDPVGPMFFRAVPIAKGNTEKVAMAEYPYTLVTWCPEAIGQGESRWE